MNLLMTRPLRLPRICFFLLRRSQFCTSCCNCQDPGRRRRGAEFLERANRWYGFFKRPDYYRRDGMGRDGHRLVYHADMDGYVKGPQLLVGLSTLLVTTGTAYLALCRYLGRSVVWSSTFLPTDTELTLTVLSLIAFNCALSFVYLRVPYRIYHRPETGDFLFLFCSPFNIFRSKKIVCRPGQMEIRCDPFCPSLTGRYRIGNRNFILYPYKFVSPAYYNALLGNKLES